MASSGASADFQRRSSSSGPMETIVDGYVLADNPALSSMYRYPELKHLLCVSNLEVVHNVGHTAVVIFTWKELNVAIKFYTAERGLEVRDQLANEAAAAATFDTGSIVQNLLVTQLHSGELTAAVYVAGGGQVGELAETCLQEAKVLRIGKPEPQPPLWVDLVPFGQLLAASALVALDSVHKQGGVVVDIKSSNIVYNETYDIFQLIDYGGCLIPNSKEAPAHTPGWLSPEEAQAILHQEPLPLHPASDLYKFGQCLASAILVDMPEEVLWWPPYPQQHEEAMQAYCSRLVEWANGGGWATWLRDQGVGDGPLLELLHGLLQPDPAKRLTAEDVKKLAWVAADVKFVEDRVKAQSAQWLQQRAAVIQLLKGRTQAQPDAAAAAHHHQQQQQQQQQLLEEQRQQLEEQRQQLEEQRQQLEQWRVQLQQQEQQLHLQQQQLEQQLQQVAGRTSDASGSHSGQDMMEAEHMADPATVFTKGGTAASSSSAAAGASSSPCPPAADWVESPSTPPAPLSRAASLPLPGLWGLLPRRSVEWDRSGASSSSGRLAGGGVSSSSSSSNLGVSGGSSSSSPSPSSNNVNVCASMDSIASALGTAADRPWPASPSSSGSGDYNTACCQGPVDSGQGMLGGVQLSSPSNQEVLSSAVMAASGLGGGSCGSDTEAYAASAGLVNAGSGALEAAAPVLEVAPSRPAGAAASSSAQQMTYASSSSSDRDSSRRSSSSACIKPGAGGEGPLVGAPPAHGPTPDAEQLIDDSFMRRLAGQVQEAVLPSPPPLPSSLVATPPARHTPPQQQHVEGAAAVLGAAPGCPIGAAVTSSALPTQTTTSSSSGGSSGGLARFTNRVFGRVPKDRAPPAQGPPPDAEELIDNRFMFGLGLRFKKGTLPQPLASSPVAAPPASPMPQQQQQTEPRAAQKAKDKKTGVGSKILASVLNCFKGSKSQVLYED